MRLLTFVMALMISLPALPEAGMIPFDVPAGEVLGKGHWYALRTMKGSEYWEEPATVTDPIEDKFGHYSIAGEPPLSLLVVLHQDYYRDDQPWRHALDEVRQAEQIFRNSGVPIRFVVAKILVMEDLPDTVKGVYDTVRSRGTVDIADSVGADMIIVLKNYFAGDPYCGVATLSTENYLSVPTSVSACGVITLVHEMGHQFGLRHSFNSVEAENELGGIVGDEEPDANRGYCIKPPGNDEPECEVGTIMSYAYTRRPFFANPNAVYKGKPLGNSTSDAVRYLNKVKTGRALAHELRQNLDIQFEPEEEVVID